MRGSDWLCVLRQTGRERGPSLTAGVSFNSQSGCTKATGREHTATNLGPRVSVAEPACRSGRDNGIPGIALQEGKPGG